MSWFSWVLIVLVIIILAGVKKRGYFWKDKLGKEITAKEFFKRFKEGVEGITPLQQTKTTLWSFLPIFAGMIWGIVIAIMVKTFWLSLILAGSLPITVIQFISNWQKYQAQKKVWEAMKDLQ